MVVVLLNCARSVFGWPSYFSQERLKGFTSTARGGGGGGQQAVGYVVLGIHPKKMRKRMRDRRDQGYDPLDDDLRLLFTLGGVIESSPVIDCHGCRGIRLLFSLCQLC